MLVAFFESVKYVGHLLPISFLRVFLGYYYLQQALLKFHGDYLSRPILAAQVGDVLPAFHGPAWYKFILETYFVGHWEIVAFTLTALEFGIAISYLIGFVTRPMALVAALLSMNMILLAGPEMHTMYKTFVAIHVALAWIGAGRCLGVDYYFYKRRRGIWW